VLLAFRPDVRLPPRWSIAPVGRRSNVTAPRHGSRVHFEIAGPIESVEVIARGVGVRQRGRLNRAFGRGRWRKIKGETTVGLRSGETRRAEVHWYKAHGIGRREYKIKRYLD